MRAAALLALAAVGCGGGMMTVRRQRPVRELPPGTQVALVRLAIAPGAVPRSCPRVSDARMRRWVLAELGEAFRMTDLVLVDRADDGLELAPEPLSLAIAIERWPCATSESAGVSTALRFDLRARDGDTIESRRVEIERNQPIPVASCRAFYEPWRAPASFGAGPGADDRGAICLAVAGFVAPYGSQEHYFSARFDRRGPARAGVALAKHGQFVAAVRSWQQHPDDPPSLFNLGMMAEIWGLDRTALIYYDAAIAAGGPSWYSGYRSSLEQRLSQVERIPLEP
jgi:hypothetical protein